MNKYLLAAVENNALWCDLVCRLNKVPGKFDVSFWANNKIAPPLYPNIITLKPISNNHDELERLHLLLKTCQLSTFFIKDSFCELDLSGLKFKKIIDAQWIAMEPSRMDWKNSPWQRVNSVSKLAPWIRSWKEREKMHTEVFKPQILTEEDVWICGLYAGNQFIQGAILYMNDNSVGISNVFSKTGTDRNFWSELVDFIGVNFPGRVIVGYESGDNLISAREAEFEAIGNLAIWKK